VAYVTPSVVFGRDTGRQFTQNTKPTASQVAEYIDLTAGELDGILRKRGYALPISATSALKLLEHYNALGAAAMIETAAPTAGGKDKTALAMWESAKKMLGDGGIELDAASDSRSGRPRHSTGATALFLRDAEV
jgi:hypothetical protein